MTRKPAEKPPITREFLQQQYDDEARAYQSYCLNQPQNSSMIRHHENQMRFWETELKKWDLSRKSK